MAFSHLILRITILTLTVNTQLLQHFRRPYDRRNESKGSQ